jgi:hypothetical protein
MKNLFFYTFHRHLDEIFFSSLFFNKSNFLKNNFDVYLHCNNIKHSKKDIETKAQFDTKVIVNITDKNAGYDWGIPESHADSFDNITKKYEYVVYLQPDCYIVNDTKFIKDFEDNNFDALICPINHCGRPCCTGDFFVTKTTKNIWSNWKECVNKYHVNEHYVFDTLVQNYKNIKTFERIDPHETMSNCRKIDKYGLWHEHNNYNVAKYLGLI